MKKLSRYGKGKTEKSADDIDGFGTRLELFGDSDLIVNWDNAVWPVYKYKQNVSFVMHRHFVGDGSRQHGLLLRENHCDWLRHGACDDGTELECNDLYVDFGLYDLRGKMIVGKCDGGYSESADFVTSGFCIGEIAVDPPWTSLLASTECFVFARRIFFLFFEYLHFFCVCSAIFISDNTYA